MSNSENGKSIAKWMDLVDSLNEAAKTEKEKNDEMLQKTDSKIMDMKLEKLNMLVRKKYYDADANIPATKMFQFAFTDHGDHYEFSIPLNVLFGKKTQEFCANYWESFFKQADIEVSFVDNIQRALKQAGGINLTMKLNKKMTKEVEPENKEELDQEAEEGHTEE